MKTSEEKLVDQDEKNSPTDDTPLDMMKRVFAVAELIVCSDTYQTPQQQQPEQHLKTRN
mgnify:CR=1 FL=1